MGARSTLSGVWHCHVRDVYRRYRARIWLMLSEQDPLFENWDQDAAAVEENYEEQDPDATLDGPSFRVESIARYMVHDPIHNAWTSQHRRHDRDLHGPLRTYGRRRHPRAQPPG